MCVTPPGQVRSRLAVQLLRLRESRRVFLLDRQIVLAARRHAGLLQGGVVKRSCTSGGWFQRIQLPNHDSASRRPTRGPQYFSGSTSACQSECRLHDGSCPTKLTVVEDGHVTPFAPSGVQPEPLVAPYAISDRPQRFRPIGHSARGQPSYEELRARRKPRRSLLLRGSSAAREVERQKPPT